MDNALTLAPTRNGAAAPTAEVHPTAHTGSPPSAHFSARTLRSALGRFATGVTIVTTRDASGTAVGFTCNSFASLSLEPPLVTWALQAVSPSRAAFEQAGHFAVNVLADHQHALAERFARRSNHKFDGVALVDAPTSNLPLLHGSLASFECRLISSQLHGDHVLFIGQVERCVQHAGEPLLFLDGKLRP